VEWYEHLFGVLAILFCFVGVKRIFMAVCDWLLSSSYDNEEWY